MSEELLHSQQADNRRTLNFLVNTSEDLEPPMKKVRQTRDPQSHRIIEKRRRDRMNNCLADLSSLIPSPYLKQGQGRIEKTEIIEMAIKHIKHLTSLIPENERPKLDNACIKQEDGRCIKRDECSMCPEKFYMGYKEGADEVMRFLVEMQGYSATDPLCKSLLKHLGQQSIKFDPKHPITSGDGNTQTVSDIELYKSSSDSARYPGKQLEGYQEELRNGDNGNLPSCMSHLHNLIQDACQEEGDGCEDGGKDNTTNDSNYGSMSSSYSMYNDTMDNGNNMDRRSSLEKSMSAYKYKNDIKSRFNADMTSSSSSASKSVSSDCMSNSSRESIGGVSQSTHDKISRLSMGQAISPNESADSGMTPYPRSDNSSMMGSSNYMGSSDGASCSPPSSGSPPLLEMSARGTMSNARGQQQQLPAPVSVSPSTAVTSVSRSASSTTETIPAFALHPGGMHYIPIVMHTCALTRHLNENGGANANGPCHLISIPVSFGGPVINVENPTNLRPSVAAVNNNPQQQQPPPVRSHGNGHGHAHGYDNSSNSSGNNNSINSHNSRQSRRRSRDFSHSHSSPFANVTASNPFLTHAHNRNGFPLSHPSGSSLSA